MKVLDTDVLIIGSGPGGATTALVLCRAHREVLLVEEGGAFHSNSSIPYSLDEMNRKYRNGGLTVAFGSKFIPYLEASCVGGGSEINAALCATPNEELLNNWENKYSLRNFTYSINQKIDQLYNLISIQKHPTNPDRLSGTIREGGRRAGWRSEEIPRFWKYDDGLGVKQTMSSSFIPEAERLGCSIIHDTKIIRLILKQKRAIAARGLLSINNMSHPVEIRFDNLFLAAGAIQTPLILRRSGIINNIGNSLCLHPMIKLVGEFPDKIQKIHEGVPVEQIVEFKPSIIIGGSHSTLPYISLWLGKALADNQEIISHPEHMGIFYAAIKAEGSGSIRNIPGINEAFVRYRLSDNDVSLLSKANEYLGKFLQGLNPTRILSGNNIFVGNKDIENVSKSFDLKHSDISALHLFSSCPMGDLKYSAVNDFGKLRGYENIYINDSSILPEAPGCNPQALIMALALRNAEYFISGEN